jgi:hypothetical protein
VAEIADTDIAPAVESEGFHHQAPNHTPMPWMMPMGKSSAPAISRP